MNCALRRTLIGSAIAACCLFPAGAVRAADDPASWVPKDALTYVGVTDCNALSAAMKRTLAWRSVEDPATQKMIEPYKKLGKKLQEYAAKKLGLESPQELEIYPQGPLAIFVTVTPRADEEPLETITAVMDMGDQLEKVKSLCDKVVRACQDRGGRKETEEVGGAQIISIHLSSDSDEADFDAAFDAKDAEITALLEDLDLDPASMMLIEDILWDLEAPETFAFAFAGNRWIVSSETVGVKQAIRQIRDGGDDSFATTPAMRTLMRKCDPAAPIRLVVNLPKIIDLAARDDQDTAKHLRAMGLSGLGPMVMTLALAPSAEVEMRAKGYMEISQDATGVAKIMRLPNGPTSPSSSVSADAAVFGMLQLDLRSIMAEIMDIVGRIDPEEGDELRAAMKVPQPDGSVLDVQKDVLDHFSGPLLGVLTHAPPYGNDDFNALLAIGHKSREGCQKLVALIPPGLIVPREMQGAAIYEVPMIPIPGMAAGLTDRSLILVGTKNAVEGFIRTESQSEGGLAGDRDFKRVASHLPAECCAIMYVNGRRHYDAMLAVHKSGDFTGEFQPAMGMSLGGVLRGTAYNNFSGAELDDPEVMRKYMTLSAFTVTTDSDGLRFEGVSVPAGELN